jgi:hypothetical protein
MREGVGGLLHSFSPYESDIKWILATEFVSYVIFFLGQQQGAD